MTFITDIATAFPAQAVTTQKLVENSEKWKADKAIDKLGIHSRYVAGPEDSVATLCTEAAAALLKKLMPKQIEEIDYLILCTQTPDYLLPTTACLVQKNLSLPARTACLDINMGCSGYIYGLSLASALIDSGQARNVLFLTGDTYTKLLAPDDISDRLIFGDGATATLLSSDSQAGLAARVGPCCLRSDGGGATHLLSEKGGLRHLENKEAQYLRMNGPEVFNFSLREVPPLIQDTLIKNNLSFEKIDLFIFHQANDFMLESLKRKLKIPDNKFMKCFKSYGNTVSSTIPISLRAAADQGLLTEGSKILLAGFGVGLSWGASV